MGTENAIEVRNVEKSFKVYKDKGNTLKAKTLFRKRNEYEEKRVLKGISFEIKKGESIGLLGRNGSGKSTTLKLLTRILRPNSGTIKMNGRVSSLIELGAGFHPDMTGRENVYINASIFGIKAKEVDRRMDDIIRFSELEEYIDSPVRTYSSGMYMRLAFSVAINVDADILLIDEILAVGDSSFQEKCFQKLRDIKRDGTTIVIVSHSLDQIKKICDRAIWLENGHIKEDGNVNKVCTDYTEEMERGRRQRIKEEALAEKGDLQIDKSQLAESGKEADKIKKLSCMELTPMFGPDARRSGNMKVMFTRIKMLNEEGQEVLEFRTGENICINMEYESEEPGTMANFFIGITRNDWVYCYGTALSTNIGHCIPAKAKGCVQINLERFNIQPGTYFLDIGIKSDDGEVLDNIYSLIEFKVSRNGKEDVGIFSNGHQWVIEEGAKRFS